MIPGNWWNIKNIEDQKKWSSLTLFLKDVYDILNRGIVLQDNFRGAIFEVEFTTAGDNVKIEHGLGFVPTKYIVLSRTAGITVYDGSLDADNRVFYLRATATGTVSVFLF